MKTHTLLLLTLLVAGPLLYGIHHLHSHHQAPAAENPPTYHEMFRPSYHFSCPKNWMNDPVGLIYAFGKYHLYYQYNPYDVIWGNMTWGHATSTDLVHWDNLPVAIDMYDNIMIFSGSSILDVNNTSGLCTEPGCMIAFYTAHDASDMEAQAMAYSNDNGTSFSQFYGNPIINLGLKTTFRDPKVFWYEPDQKWVMVTAQPFSYNLILYYSKDLIQWVQLSIFGPDGSEAGGWEDPDLYELPINDQGDKRWVIAHSVAVDAVEYYIGEFDGTKFTNTETKGLELYYDYGFDFDEAATWNNEPKGRRLIIAWLDEGGYGGDLPTKVWRGQLTLIRELTIKQYPEGLRVISNPISEYEALRDTNYHYDSMTLSSENVTLNFSGVQLEIIAEFVISDEDAPEEFGVKVLTGDNQTTIIGYNTTAGLLFVDRTNSGLMNFSTSFLSICNTTLKPENSTIQLRIFVDHSSVEVFANNGRIAMTNLVFPDPTKDSVEVYAIGGKVTISSIDAWSLKDIWGNSTVLPTPPEKKEAGDVFLPLLDRLNSLISG